MIAVLLMVTIAELLTRGLFLAYVKLSPPPNCGMRPALLARLHFAYSGGTFSLTGPGSVAVADPHRGHRSAPGLKGLMVTGAPVSTNSLGARAEREYAVPKPAGTRRIVALGDSMTYGEGVTNDSTWPAQLEGLLQQTEVVNLGDRAYAHDQMYFTLKDSGARLTPDVVVLGFFEADLMRDDLEHYCYEKPRLSQSPAGWVFENVPVPTPAELRARYLSLPLLVGVPQLFWQLRNVPPMGSQREGDASGTEALNRIRKLAEASGGRFLMVDLPEHLDHPPVAESFFKSYCARTKTECVETLADFQQAAPGADRKELERRFLRPNDIHYARAGYAVIASAVARYLNQRP